MAEVHSIDATLVKDMSQRSENAQAPVQAAVPEVSTPQEPVRQAVTPLPESDPESSNDPEPSSLSDSPAESLPVAAETTTQDDEGSPSSPSSPSSSPIDEYGNPIAKPKMYSEEEVQRMIRDRLSRGRQAAEQPT